jgi:type III pantothenate kinase
MLLTIDVGNTQIYAGVFDGDKIKASFRRTSSGAVTSDELGVFLLQVLRANAIKPRAIAEIAIASVVPDLTRSIANCARKYFCLEPFIVGQETKSGLFIKGGAYNGLGADRIAGIEGAIHLYPRRNLIVVDFGTANTFDAVHKSGEYRGGAISAGVGMSMSALASGTALLSNVEIKNPGHSAGMNTTTQLQSGLFYTGLGSMKEICTRLGKECFRREDYIIIGTGGLGRLYEHENVFKAYVPDLVLIGLRELMRKNTK